MGGDDTLSMEHADCCPLEQWKFNQNRQIYELPWPSQFSSASQVFRIETFSNHTQLAEY